MCCYFRNEWILFGPAGMVFCGLALCSVSSSVAPIGVVLVLAAPVAFVTSVAALIVDTAVELTKEQQQNYDAFYLRVGGGDRIRQPDRVRALYDRLSPEGRYAIQTYEQFCEHEEKLGSVAVHSK